MMLFPSLLVALGLASSVVVQARSNLTAGTETAPRNWTTAGTFLVFLVSPSIRSLTLMLIARSDVHLQVQTQLATRKTLNTCFPRLGPLLSLPEPKMRPTDDITSSRLATCRLSTDGPEPIWFDVYLSVYESGGIKTYLMATNQTAVSGQETRVQVFPGTAVNATKELSLDNQYVVKFTGHVRNTTAEDGHDIVRALPHL